MTMLLSLISIIFVSLLFKILFERKILPKEADIFKCVVNVDTDTEKSEVSSELETKDGHSNLAYIPGSMGDLKNNTKL